MQKYILPPAWDDYVISNPNTLGYRPCCVWKKNEFTYGNLWNWLSMYCAEAPSIHDISTVHGESSTFRNRVVRMCSTCGINAASTGSMSSTNGQTNASTERAGSTVRRVAAVLAVRASELYGVPRSVEIFEGVNDASARSIQWWNPLTSTRRSICKRIQRWTGYEKIQTMHRMSKYTSHCEYTAYIELILVLQAHAVPRKRNMAMFLL